MSIAGSASQQEEGRSQVAMMSAGAAIRHRPLLGLNGANGGGGGGDSDENFSDDDSTPLTQDIYNGR